MAWKSKGVLLTVHCDASRMWLHPFPGPIRHENLQCSNGLAEQQRQRPKVSMASRVDVLELGVLLRRSGAIYHVSKMAVREIIVSVAIRQVVFGQLKNDGDECQQLLDCVLCNMSLELFNLCSVLVNNFWMTAFELWKMFENVVHLNVIAQSWEKLNSAFRSVAGIVAFLKPRPVLKLLFLWQSEDLLADGELTINLVLGQAKVCDLLAVSATARTYGGRRT